MQTLLPSAAHPGMRRAYHSCCLLMAAAGRLTTIARDLAWCREGRRLIIGITAFGAPGTSRSRATVSRSTPTRSLGATPRITCVATWMPWLSTPEFRLSCGSGTRTRPTSLELLVDSATSGPVTSTSGQAAGREDGDSRLGYKATKSRKLSGKRLPMVRMLKAASAELTLARGDSATDSHGCRATEWWRSGLRQGGDRPVRRVFPGSAVWLLAPEDAGRVLFDSLEHVADKAGLEVVVAVPASIAVGPVQNCRGRWLRRGPGRAGGRGLWCVSIRGSGTLASTFRIKYIRHRCQTAPIMTVGLAALSPRR